MRPLGMLLACAALAAAQDADLVRRSYDVRVLVHGESSRHGPRLSLRSRPVVIAIAEDESGPAMDADLLQQVLRAMTGPSSWDGDALMEVTDAGCLEVLNTPAVQTRVAAALETLGRLASRRVAVDARLLLLAPGVLESTGAEPGPLAPAQEKALLEAATDGKRGRLAAVLTGSAPPDVWSFAADVRERRLVTDFDLQIANGAVVAEPVSQLVLDGAVMDFRALLDPDGARLLLEYRFSAARPGTVRDFDGKTKPEGRLALPSRPLFEARGACLLSSGKTALMLPGAVDGIEAGWTPAVLVRARRGDEPPGSLPLAAEGIHLRALEVGSLIRGAGDAEGAALRLGDLPGMEVPLEVRAEQDHCDIAPADVLAGFLRVALGPTAFDGEGCEILEGGDRLLLTNREPVLDAAERYLEELSAKTMRNVAVDAAVISISPARRRGLPPAELLALARSEDGARFVARGGVLGIADLQVASFAGAESLFVREREVEVAERAAGTHPWLDTFTEGLCLTVRASRTGEEGRARLDIRADYGSNPGIARVETGAAPGGAMEASTLDLFSCDTSLELATGEWTLAAESLQPPGDGDRGLRVLLVRVRYPETR